MRHRITTFFQSPRVKNITLLVGGQAGGQAVAMLSYIVLCRMYTKADFGLFALFAGISGVLAILSTGKYENGILMAKDEKETNLLLGFTLKLLLIFCASLFPILFLCCRFELPPFSPIASYWFLIPVSVFFIGLFEILSGLSNKDKEYKTIAVANVSLNIKSALFRILFGFTSFGEGLIFGQVASQALSFFSFRKLKPKLKSILQGNWKEEKAVARSFIIFPKYGMARNFINSYSGNLPILLLTGIFGEESIGLYSFALTLIFRPINVISNSLYLVYYEQSATLKQENKSITILLKKLWPQLFKKSLLLFVIAFLLAPVLFKYVFGSQWEESAHYFRYMIPWMFMVLITTPLGFIPVIFNKQKHSLWIEITYLIIRLVALYIGIYMDNFDLAILLFSISGFVFMCATLIWYIRLLNNYEKELKSNHDRPEANI